MAEDDDPLTVKSKSFVELFPDLDFFLYRGILNTPQMCSLKELTDGSYSMYDIYLLHELMDAQQELKIGTK